MKIKIKMGTKIIKNTMTCKQFSMPVISQFKNWYIGFLQNNLDYGYRKDMLTQLSLFQLPNSAGHQFRKGIKIAFF